MIDGGALVGCTTHHHVHDRESVHQGMDCRASMTPTGNRRLTHGLNSGIIHLPSCAAFDFASFASSDSIFVRSPCGLSRAYPCLW